tara:strand:- start:26028 stop:26237 length:210 start_codon:yes stop_codon:yes gene_type:complete
LNRASLRRVGSEVQDVISDICPDVLLIDVVSPSVFACVALEFQKQLVKIYMPDRADLRGHGRVGSFRSA